jgi:Tfp pilus assembly protein PilN
MSVNLRELRKLLAVGTGVAIEIGDGELRVVAARVRPGGVRLLGSATITGFPQRPAADWGLVYADFVKRAGAAHVSATVVLPRHEVILRVMPLAGVADRDIASAVQFQIDSMHPFPEEEAACAWARLGTSGSVLVAITRKSTIDRYISLFEEAGVKVAAFTFSAAALYSAVHLLSQPPDGGFLAFTGNGVAEAYGESEARPLFSAQFDLPRERATGLAAAELRLDPAVEPLDAAALLPSPQNVSPDFDLSRNALTYAAALAGACPRLALPINLLPAEHRSSNARAMYVPAAALALLAILCGIALASIQPVEDRKYGRALEQEIAKVEPLARQAGELDRATEAARARIRLLDAFHRRTQADLDAIAEVNRILDPPAYLSSMDLTRDSIVLSGSAEHAEQLLKLLDNSPLFQGSEFTVPLTPAGKLQLFRIRSGREGVAK